MKRIDIIKKLLSGRNEKLLGFLFKTPMDLITDENGAMDLEYIRENVGVYSSGEQIMCKVAMDIWGEYGKAELFDICRRLDSETFVKVMEALVEFRGI